MDTNDVSTSKFMCPFGSLRRNIERKAPLAIQLWSIIIYKVDNAENHVGKKYELCTLKKLISNLFEWPSLRK